ncbi:MAG: ABC transporter substrate-binding protein [Campylobacterota bacterium]|nr:ABC transporter substrate-binding protein [Campylobacterota bacterium]
MLKKLLLIVVFQLLLQGNSKDVVVIAGPSASVTHPVFYMIQNDAFKSMGKTIKFKHWKNPDQLKAMILNKKVDFISAPITASSILYNKGVDLKLTHLVIGGARGILSRDKSIKSIKDLKGKTLGIPARGGLGDSLVKILLKENGLDVKKDIKIVYTSSSKNSTMMLLKGKIDCAVFSEPRLSMTLKKAKSLPSDKNPHKLFFNIDILKQWKKTFDTNTTFAQVAFLAVGKTAYDKKFIKKFVSEYDKALVQYIKYPKKSAKLVSKNLKWLHPKAVINGIKNSSLYILKSSKDKQQIKKLLNNLVKYNPKSMGKKAPNDGFYFSK